MWSVILELAAAAAVLNVANASPVAKAGWHTPYNKPTSKEDYYISLGPRPYYIVDNMTDSPLKTKLQSCANGPFEVTAWSIGHRGGGTLQIPEETTESTNAGARMGAGVLECDVAFTADRGLVCRHDLCDLATTTDILVRPALAAKCTVPFKPANGSTPASATCCTSDITLDEFTGLCSKMDGSNKSALTPQAYVSGGYPSFRTGLYNTCGKVMTLESYIDLVDSLPGYRNFTPELKTPPAAVPMPFKGYTQEQYARDMLDTFLNKGINPLRVWPQSFNPPDVFQWIKEYPDTFGPQAVYLDESGDDPENFTIAVNRLGTLKSQGVNIIAPPFNYLLTTGGPNNDTIVPSSYATTANEVGLSIISWSFDRSGPLTDVAKTEDYYYNTFASAVHTDGQLYEILDVLANDIKIAGLFSDWSATLTYFANCFDLKGPKGEDYH